MARSKAKSLHSQSAGEPHHNPQSGRALFEPQSRQHDKWDLWSSYKEATQLVWLGHDLRLACQASALARVI